ncbi:MAG: hypothetical protein PWP24_1171, partial [Clostridiales bacterium]|nr:hypothetical protein [Clostridiales bacterium]
LNAIVLFCLLLFSLKKKKTYAALLLPVFLSGFIALIISIQGPGNALRQSTIGAPHNPIVTIFLSFVYGGYSIANATTVPILLFWLLFIPIFWKMLAGTKLTFLHPLITFFISFCIYSSQITPVIYAQGIRIPYRIRNIVSFHYYLFVAFNLFCLLGYLHQNNKLPGFKRPFPLTYYYLFLSLAILFSCMGHIVVNEGNDGAVTLSNLPFSASAVYSLATGEAKAYDAEENHRTDILSTTKKKYVALAPIQHKPYVLFHSDISYDPSYWKNEHLARYYKKRTVRLE